MSEFISCKYNLGGQCTITSSWQGKNMLLPHSKFYYLYDGELFLEIAGQYIVAKKGDLVLIPANILHSCGLTELRYMKKAWCHFEMKCGQEEFFLRYQIPFCLHIDDREYMDQLFEDLFRAQTLSPCEQDLRSAEALCRIVSYYFEHSTVITKTSASDQIDDCIQYINDNYAEISNINVLAKRANYSLNHFIKKFKEKTGYTPTKYINSVKINAARSLLQHHNDSISEIMQKTGFLDSAYFTKLFKKHIGYSPKKFRQMCWAQNPS